MNHLLQHPSMTRPTMLNTRRKRPSITTTPPHEIKMENENEELCIQDENSTGTWNINRSSVPEKQQKQSTPQQSNGDGSNRKSKTRSRRRLSFGGKNSHDTALEVLYAQLCDKEQQIEALKNRVYELEQSQPAPVVFVRPLPVIPASGKAAKDEHGLLPCTSHGRRCEKCLQLVAVPKWARKLGIPQTAKELEAEKKRIEKLSKKRGWGRRAAKYALKIIKSVDQVEKEIAFDLNNTVLD